MASTPPGSGPLDYAFVDACMLTPQRSCSLPALSKCSGKVGLDAEAALLGLGSSFGLCPTMQRQIQLMVCPASLSRLQSGGAPALYAQRAVAPVCTCSPAQSEPQP